MSIVVEHEKRRRDILEKALDIFMEEGFENVTLQKIANRCNITRTTLYLYFKNKRDVFNYSIKQLLQMLENDIGLIRQNKSLSHGEKLIQIMMVIIENAEENRRLFAVVLHYLVYASRNPNERVRRRTVRIRHIMATMIIEGIKAGEFCPSINVKAADELLYSILEAAAFRLVVLRRSSVEDLKDTLKLVISHFAVGAA